MVKFHRKSQNKTLLPLRQKRNEIIAEGEPVVGVVEVADPIQIRLAIRVIPPDIARVRVALKGYVRDTVCATTPRILEKVVSYLVSTWKLTQS